MPTYPLEGEGVTQRWEQLGGVADNSSARTVATYPATGAPATPVSIAAGSNPNGVVSPNSTYDAPPLAALAGNGVFTPSGGANNGFDDLYALGFPSSVSVSVHTDANSAGGGLQVQWSYNAATVDIADVAYVNHATVIGGNENVFGSSPSGLQKTFVFPVRDYQYCRVVYTNGSGAQTVFHLRAIYRYNPTERGLQHRYSPDYQSWEPVPTNCFRQIIPGQANKTTSTLSGLQNNLGWAGIVLDLIVTSVSGTGGLYLALNYLDNANNPTQVNTSLTGAALVTATGTYRWIWHPSANGMNTGPPGSTVKQLVGLPLPQIFTVQVVHTDAGAPGYSYQVQGHLTIF